MQFKSAEEVPDGLQGDQQDFCDKTLAMVKARYSGISESAAEIVAMQFIKQSFVDIEKKKPCWYYQRGECKAVSSLVSVLLV